MPTMHYFLTVLNKANISFSKLNKTNFDGYAFVSSLEYLTWYVSLYIEKITYFLRFFMLVLKMVYNKRKNIVKLFTRDLS